MVTIRKNHKLFLILIILSSTLISACSSMSPCKACPPCPVVATDNDSKITDSVQHALMKNNSDIAHLTQIQTKNGVVLLSGFVNNKKQASAAIDTASKVPGVKQVKAYFVNKF